MTIQELFKITNKENIVNYMINLIKERDILLKENSKELNKDIFKGKIEKLIEEFKTCKTKATPNSELLVIPYIEDGDFVFDVAYYDMADPSDCGTAIIMTDMDVCAGLEINNKIMKHISPEIICGEVLYEYTFFGSDEETRANEIQKLLEDMDDFDEDEIDEKESDFYECMKELKEECDIDESVLETNADIQKALLEYEVKINTKIKEYFFNT